MTGLVNVGVTTNTRLKVGGWDEGERGVRLKVRIEQPEVELSGER